MCEIYDSDERFLPLKAAAQLFNIDDLNEFYRSVESSGCLVCVGGRKLVDTAKYVDWEQEEARRLAARPADEPSDKGDAVRTHRT